MGGRGVWSHTLARMVNYKRAIIRRERISNYLLNPKKSKGKAEYLASLGYNMKNQARLQADIREAMKTAKVRVSEPNKYGTIHIQANIELGINKRHIVVAGWIMRKGSNIPELSTLRPYKGTKDDF